MADQPLVLQMTRVEPISHKLINQRSLLYKYIMAILFIRAASYAFHITAENWWILINENAWISGEYLHSLFCIGYMVVLFFGTALCALYCHKGELPNFSRRQF
jgi:hypothetical protein